MVTYFDSSALLPLVLGEATTERYLDIAQTVKITTWWGSYIECAAAIVRHARSETTAPAQIAESYRMLDQLSQDWAEIPASQELRRAAVRVARESQLRSGDALQLGAALLASGFDPPTARFLAEDRELRRAAEAQGFIIE